MENLFFYSYYLLFLLLWESGSGYFSFVCFSSFMGTLLFFYFIELENTWKGFAFDI